MGNRGPYHWDDAKSRISRENHGMTISQVCDLVFFTSSTIWDIFENPRYPSQYRIIAKTKKFGFVTLAAEDQSDKYGTFIKLITWWPSSKTEQRKFIND